MQGLEQGPCAGHVRARHGGALDDVVLDAVPIGGHNADARRCHVRLDDVGQRAVRAPRAELGHDVGVGGVLIQRRAADGGHMARTAG